MYPKILGGYEYYIEHGCGAQKWEGDDRDRPWFSPFLVKTFFFFVEKVSSGM